MIEAREPEKEKRKIKSVKRMKEIMTEYYIGAKTAAETGKKVAWITSGGPVEPLIAMDVIPVYPENHSYDSLTDQVYQKLASEVTN